jgi:hypothetical protein
MNQWSKRESFSYRCTSGNEATVRRIGPSLTLKAGKASRVLQRQAEEVKDIESQLRFIENLPEDEATKLYDFARIVICDVVVTPPLFLNPRDGELSPDDLPVSDFWELFIAASNGFPGMPVKLKEGETTVDAVAEFPGQSGGGLKLDGDSPTVQ